MCKSGVVGVAAVPSCPDRGSEPGHTGPPASPEFAVTCQSDDPVVVGPGPKGELSTLQELPKSWGSKAATGADVARSALLGIVSAVTTDAGEVHVRARSSFSAPPELRLQGCAQRRER